MFEKKGARALLFTIVYGGLLAAFVVCFGWGCLNQKRANEMDFMIFCLALSMMGSPYLVYVANDLLEGEGAAGFLHFLGHLLSYVALGLLLLMLTSEHNNPKFYPVAVGALFAMPLQLISVSSVENWASMTLASLLGILLPAVGFFGGWILYTQLRLVVCVMLAGSLFVLLFAYTACVRPSGSGLLFSGAMTLVFFIASFACGLIHRKSLDYRENYVNGFIFLPLLTTIVLAFTAIGGLKNKVREPQYFKVFLTVAFVLTVALQYLTLFKWFIGLGGVAVLIIVLSSLNAKNGTPQSSGSSYSSSSSSSYSSGYDDDDLEAEVAYAISYHMLSVDRVLSTWSSRSGSQLTIGVEVGYSAGRDSHYSHYRSCINTWVDKYKRYASKLSTPTSGIRIEVRFTPLD